MAKKNGKLLLLMLILIISMLPLKASGNEPGLEVIAKDLEMSSDAQITINYDLELIFVSTRVDEARKPHVEIDLMDVDFGNQANPMSATFIQKIYDRNGLPMATAYVTVEGWHSEEEQRGEIKDISCKFEGERAQKFSYSTKIDKENGSIMIYDGAGENGFNYTIDFYGII